MGGTTAGPGMCVVNVYVNYEKKFAFVEMRTGEARRAGEALGGGLSAAPAELHLASGCTSLARCAHNGPILTPRAAVEEASNAMALDGIMFEGAQVRIRRPADYNAAAAAPLGPSMPNPNLNLAAIGLDKQPVPLPTTNLMSQMVGPGMTAQPQVRIGPGLCRREPRQIWLGDLCCSARVWHGWAAVGCGLEGGGQRAL